MTVRTEKNATKDRNNEVISQINSRLDSQPSQQRIVSLRERLAELDLDEEMGIQGKPRFLGC